MRIDRNHAKSAFEEYTRHYDTGDDKVRLKIEHTYRVAGLCEEGSGGNRPGLAFRAAA